MQNSNQLQSNPFRLFRSDDHFLANFLANDFFRENRSQPDNLDANIDIQGPFETPEIQDYTDNVPVFGQQQNWTNFLPYDEIFDQKPNHSILFAVD
jgi:hypothetical protein